MKLISMVDFVISQQTRGMEIQSLGAQYQERARRFYLIQNYAKFLKQPLTLGMFAPCDENGNPFEVQVIRRGNEILNQPDIDKYEQAKEKVLFEGFEIINDELYVNSEFYMYICDIQSWKIEDIEGLFSDVQLTQSALKQLGL